MPSRTTAMQKQIYDFFLNCNGKFVFSAPPTTPTVDTRHAASLQTGTPLLIICPKPLSDRPQTRHKAYSIHIVLI